MCATQPTVIAILRAHGHDPCVVLQTSPGHLQAWIRLSASPLEPAVATAAGKLLVLEAARREPLFGSHFGAPAQEPFPPTLRSQNGPRRQGFASPRPTTARP